MLPNVLRGRTIGSRAPAKHVIKKEAEALAVLGNYKPREALVSSLPEVIDACERFVVHTLLVNTGLRKRGFVCEGHHHVSLQPGKCPVDSTKLRSAKNVIDELLEVDSTHRRISKRMERTAPS